MRQVTLLAIVLLAGLLILERLLPLRARRAGIALRMAVNASLAAIAYTTSGLLVTPVALRLAGLTTTQEIGLLPWLALPSAAVTALALLTMDLSFYYWHRLNHRLPLLWRFHNVHHVDRYLDVTTALRFHFGEIMFSTFFRSLQVTLLGVGPVAYVIYEALLQSANLFHHSNLRLPIGFERALNLVFVTPRMHGIHHSEIEGEANSNYSVVFSFWDRLHRSLCLGVPQAEVTVGVPAYREPADQRLLGALSLPFRRQRDYWRRPDGTRPEPRAAAPARRLAE
jgi:sterol desaturase/sphingolipid hydroxylase (fatty acid hydroxylase superfamily)